MKYSFNRLVTTDGIAPCIALSKTLVPVWRFVSCPHNLAHGLGELVGELVIQGMGLPRACPGAREEREKTNMNLIIFLKSPWAKPLGRLFLN